MNTIKRIALAVLALLVLAGCAQSTSGVTVVGDNIINLPAGDTAEFSYNNGRTYTTWSVTFNASTGIVDVDCSSLCPNGSASVPNIGDKDWANSSLLIGNFHATRTSETAVSLEWPWGMALE